MKIQSQYIGHRLQPEIISHAVWLNHRFTLSFRDVEDLLAERDIMVSFETAVLKCDDANREVALRVTEGNDPYNLQLNGQISCTTTIPIIRHLAGIDGRITNLAARNAIQNWA